MMALKLVVNPSKPNAILSVYLCALYQKLSDIDFKPITDLVEYGDAKGVTQVLLAIFPCDEQIKKWTEFCDNSLSTKVFAQLQSAFAVINEHLKLRTFICDNEIGPADYVVYAALRNLPVWLKNFKENSSSLPVELVRWYSFVNSLKLVEDALNTIAENDISLKSQKKDQASFDIDLPDAEFGKVVTRFPPEPSGYLHIGHAKAVLLNQYFAKHYGGKLIIRFDDTNPDKETSEFEQVILEDLQLLGVKGDIYSRTSDYFDTTEKYAIQMIEEGNAYCDDTPQDKMREERGNGIPSACRDNSVEENLRRFQEMKQGSAEGLKNCLRAKIDMQHLNKALRDPVLYRCNLNPHHHSGNKYKVYPTYDFACPIVDSVEGVTHALRTSEYNDRNAQYQWILQALKLRKVHIWDYSRLNFVYTLLSKRNLKWFVNEKRASGWDDPRFPTVRGILRRGLTLEALREYILMQGPSKNTILLEWDKLWSVNKKQIDPVAPRFTALNKDGLVKMIIKDGPSEPFTKEIPRHKKNPEVGTKLTSYSSIAFIEQADAATLSKEEEITLMDWGNVIITDIVKENGQVLVLEAKLHLDGDFKKTEKKLTWLSPDPQHLQPVTLLDYDYLITKKKLEENDNLQDFLTPVTEFKTEALGDANLTTLKKGDIIQLERKGYFITDEVNPLRLILIPDGKAKSISCKSPLPKPN
jgi:glutamyl-tRNA synthetase